MLSIKPRQRAGEKGVMFKLVKSRFSEVHFCHRELVVFRIAKIKITVGALITSYTNLATLKLVTHSSVPTRIHFTRTLLIFRFVIASMGFMSL